MRTKLIALAILGATTTFAFAQGLPNFITETYPSHASESFMKNYGTLKGEGSALDAKTFELIGLAVAAQIPCEYCVYAHTKQAKLAGATDAELKEAVAMAGAVRAFSTVFNGAAYDFEAFKSEHDKLVPPPSE